MHVRKQPFSEKTKIIDLYYHKEISYRRPLLEPDIFRKNSQRVYFLTGKMIMKSKLFLLGFVCLAMNVSANEEGGFFSKLHWGEGAKGPRGEPGLQGPQGKTGPQGVTGKDGESGSAGKAGPRGPAGLQGLAGPRGVQGEAGPQGITGGAVASLFSLANQSVSPGEVVLFEGVNSVSFQTYDVSLAATSGRIVFLESGIYNISWEVEGKLTPPFPNPVPGWGLALYLDEVPVLGSCFPGFTQAPSGQAVHAGGRIAIEIVKGQTLTLQSVSVLPISLVSTNVAESLSTVSASIMIESE